MIVYRAILDVPRELVRYVSRLLAAERRARGTRKDTRALTCWYQALMVLVWFRKGEDKTLLGAGFGVSWATAYRYVAEAIKVLTAQAPSLHDALRRVAADGWSHVICDGKSTDRLAETTTRRLARTIEALAEAQQPETEADHQRARVRAVLASCDTKLVRHRAALEAGADPAIVTGWIADVEADRRRALATIQNTAQSGQSPARMTKQQIHDLVTSLGDIVAVLNEADPADRAEVYRQLGLRLTYYPEQQKVRVRANPDADQFGDLDGVRGVTRTKFPDQVLLDIEVYVE